LVALRKILSFHEVTVQSKLLFVYLPANERYLAIIVTCNYTSCRFHEVRVALASIVGTLKEIGFPAITVQPKILVKKECMREGKKQRERKRGRKEKMEDYKQEENRK
jgi:hypothetical protein